MYLTLQDITIMKNIDKLKLLELYNYIICSKSKGLTTATGRENNKIFKKTITTRDNTLTKIAESLNKSLKKDIYRKELVDRNISDSFI